MVPADRFKEFFAAALAVGALAFALHGLRHPVYTPDGLIYTQMMLADRGTPTNVAHDRAVAFYLTTPIGHDPRYRPYITGERPGMFTPTAKPFASRVLYPLIGAALFPWTGFGALPLISAIAYSGAVLAMYWLLLTLCRPWIAALGALVFAATPELRALSNAALTDMLALAFVTLVFAAAIRYSIGGKSAYLVLALFGEVALSLTRPLPYVPLCGALALGIWALAERDRAQQRRALLLLAACIVGWAAYSISAVLTKTPSLAVHLRWLYNADKTHWLYQSRPLSDEERRSFNVWYERQLVWAAKAFISSCAHRVYPVVGFILFAIGVYLNRRIASVALLSGFLFGCLLGILANPVPIELTRLIELPAAPVIFAGIAILAEYLASRRVKPLTRIS